VREKLPIKLERQVEELLHKGFGSPKIQKVTGLPIARILGIKNKLGIGSYSHSTLTEFERIAIRAAIELSEERIAEFFATTPRTIRRLWRQMK
jgi:hypothetical protein